MTSRPWVCTVRLNDHDKAYFDRQLAGFTQTDPLLITWEDTRAAPARPSVSPGTPWERLLPVPGARRLQSAGLRLRALTTANPFAAPAGEQAWFRRLAETEPPSVIYAHTAFVALRLLPVAAALGVPLVAHFHGLDVTRRDPVWRNALRAALPAIDRLIVVGDWMHERLTALGADPVVIETIPMGAPLDAATRVTPAPRTGERFRFVTVGRLVPCKGVDRTLQALAEVEEAELVIVGGGPLLEPLKAEAALLDLGDRARFLGQKSAAEALAEVAAADAMAHHAVDEPGGPEAFGVVITEAMALGKPVVGTWCGGLPDQIEDGENGLLVAQEDVSGMAAAMRRLARDPDLTERLGRAAREGAARFDSTRLGTEAENSLLQTIG